MKQALGGNLDLKMALARIDQARAERRGTRAELFPTVDAAAGAQRADNPFPALRPVSVTTCSNWGSTPCGKSIYSAVSGGGWKRHPRTWRRRRSNTPKLW